jgi:GNAT superfamily N-acetyltransferase
MNIQLVESTIDCATYKKLRESVGWPLPPDSAITVALANSVYSIQALVEGQAVGMGRIIGDHGFIYFIADIIVTPEFQQQGIGNQIMTKIITYLQTNAPPHAYITLMAAGGKEAFYEKFGFFKRPTGPFGHGMMIEL